MLLALQSAYAISRHKYVAPFAQSFAVHRAPRRTAVLSSFFCLSFSPSFPLPPSFLHSSINLE